MTTNNTGHCGYVAIIGHPNVGKSTLLNRLLGQKISITSRKPQTTRHRLLGIKTTGNDQVIYVDTPGFHQDRHNAMNRYLNRTARNSIEDVDVILWLLEALRWTKDDAYLLSTLARSSVPVMLAINKIDSLPDKQALLPYLQQVATYRHFLEVFPISARTSDNLVSLEQAIIQLLPLRPPDFPEDQLTDRSERFLVAELIREKLTRHLGAELPYCLTVQTDHFEDQADLTYIAATIWVERPSQKPIIIGKQGQRLKIIGQEARHDIETLLGKQVFLQVWVKLKRGWSDDERALRHLGYE